MHLDKENYLAEHSVNIMDGHVSQINSKATDKPITLYSTKESGTFSEMNLESHGLAQGESEEHMNQTIQEKLTRARKRVRQFKKKLGLMKVFIEKYEKRALEKGSQEIYSAVMILVEEHDKHEYGLNQEESEVLDRMKTFGANFSKLWGGAESEFISSGLKQSEGPQIVAKIRPHNLSDKIRGDQGLAKKHSDHLADEYHHLS